MNSICGCVLRSATRRLSSDLSFIFQIGIRAEMYTSCLGCGVKRFAVATRSLFEFVEIRGRGCRLISDEIE
jgi:hypothetical protein